MGRLKIIQEDDSVERVAYLSDVQEVADDVDDLLEDVDDLQSDLASHKAEKMPHQFTNLQTGKTYRFGRQVSAEGIPQRIYEEVIE